MPGWYIHMDVARKSLQALTTNANAAQLFAGNGPSAAALEQIAKDNPAYVALGAIGPDIFFLLPDFKPPVGTMLWGAANTIKEIYTWWDENFLGPWEDQIGPIEDNFADQVDAVTGGLANQLSSIASRAFSFLIDTILVMVLRQYDVFGLLGSGVPSGTDEQVFFWSDMLHYRKTYDFALKLWNEAEAADDDRFRAFALGWMTHLATDVTGHAFVNEKAGGPYRLHWQRHHLVENHMDAKIYDVENGMAPLYFMLSCSALHLWIAFNPDGSSREDCFAAQPGPVYKTGDKTPDLLDRKSHWDVDSDIPDDLANFLSTALQDFYVPGNTGSADTYNPANPTETPSGQWACCPTIITDLSDDIPGVDPPANVTKRGYASPDAIVTTYWWLYHYVKWITTDYYKIRRPTAPDVINIPPFPSPPGTGASDPGPGSSDDSAWHDFLEVLLAIFAWIVYLAEVASWPATALIGLIASAGTYPVRELLYENVELPLYNAWLALHWYLAMTGFTAPMTGEINAGLITLGIGVADVWQDVQMALNDPAGGLHASPSTANELSGTDVDRRYPIGPVTDDPNSLTLFINNAVRHMACANDPRSPSEFRRPWLFPDANNDGTSIKTERTQATDGRTLASPYLQMQDVTTLLSSMPGDNEARRQLAGAKDEAETIRLVQALLGEGHHLGDPIDYASFVVAELTRTHANTAPANFNLDADRGYAYLCWDWLRSGSAADVAVPGGVANATFPPPDQREYRAPLAAGYGWCEKELEPGSASLDGWDPDPNTTPHAVKLRYLDRNKKTP